jgi:hypothetical protein
MADPGVHEKLKIDEEKNNGSMLTSSDPFMVPLCKSVCFEEKRGRDTNNGLAEEHSMRTCPLAR